MSKSKRELSGDEKKLWRRVADSVKPRRPAGKRDEAGDLEPERPVRSPTRTSAAPLPSQRLPPAKAPPPANRGAEKRVRRGKLEIGATLDLHGHTQDSGRAALLRFLRAAQKRGDGTVIVVTGVGRGGEGVLKRRFPEWLAEQDIRKLITGYAQAHRTHGGAGASYVFIKRAG